MLIFACTIKSNFAAEYIYLHISSCKSCMHRMMCTEWQNIVTWSTSWRHLPHLKGTFASSWHHSAKDVISPMSTWTRGKMMDPGLTGLDHSFWPGPVKIVGVPLLDPRLPHQGNIATFIVVFSFIAKARAKADATGVRQEVMHGNRSDQGQPSIPNRIPWNYISTVENELCWPVDICWSQFISGRWLIKHYY